MRAVFVVLLVIAIATEIVAIAAGANLALALPSAVAALTAAAVASAVALFGRIRWSEAAPRPAEADTLVSIREAFRTGELGRRNLVATIQSLERDLLRREAPRLSQSEERTILALPTDRFRRWVEERIARMEATS